MFFRWQERDEDSSEGEDLLLDQLMVGLQPAPVKQELNRQMRRNDQMSLPDPCKEVCALKLELLEGDDSVSVLRVTVPEPRK